MKRFVLFLLIAFVAASCSSTSEKPVKKKVNSEELPTRIKSRVEIKNDDGSITPVITPGSKETTVIDPKTGKRFKSEGWVDATKVGQVPGKHLRPLSEEQLLSRVSSASAREATLIIEECKIRRRKGVKVLAALLDDSRPAVFMRGREYWWYEKKDEPGEAIEVRTYAAYTLQFILGKYPSGVSMGMTKEKMVFAVKDKHAVVKDDLNKVWKMWWQQNKQDF